MGRVYIALRAGDDAYPQLSFSRLKKYGKVSDIHEDATVFSVLLDDKTAGIMKALLSLDMMSGGDGICDAIHTLMRITFEAGYNLGRNEKEG